MLALPIPLIVALVLSFLCVRLLLSDERPPLFAALLFISALQGLLISLVHHYGIDGLRPVLPVLATVIPPLAWLTFQSAALRGLDPARDAFHLIAPVFTAFCLIFAPVTLDVVVTGVFVIYGVAMIWRLWGGGDLPLARLDAGGLPVLVWRALAVALLLSALSDGMIAWALSQGFEALPPLIVSIFSSLALLVIGLLSLSPNAQGAPEVSEPSEAPATATEEHDALVARLTELLKTEKLYLEPDLTLARLARRLHVPIKALSEAINRSTGGNVSRFVNGYRIRHACARLEAGESVTNAMLSSGFNTKSNFNREFLRVTGKAPRNWVGT